MSTRTFFILIAIAFLSWGGNWWYYQSNQLTQPIFLTHYYDGELDPTFYYITNKNDPKQVRSIVLEGDKSLHTSDESFGIIHNHQQGPTIVNRYTHQALASITINLHQSQYDSIDHKGEATVYFQDGSSIKTEIGTVSYSSNINPNETSVFTDTVHSGNNRGRDTVTLHAKEDVTITDIQFPSEEMAEHFAVKVDANQEKLGHLDQVQENHSLPEWFDEEMKQSWVKVPGVHVRDDPFPLTIQHMEWVKINVQKNTDWNMPYRIEVQVRGEKANGESFSFPFHLMNDRPSLSEQEVNELMKGGGPS